MMNFPGSDAISIFPQFSIETDDQSPDFDPSPPFKRPRSSDETQPNHNHHNSKAPNNIFFKTRLCVKFKNGTCRNGEDCNFAHGIEDVRQPPPNWQEMVGLRGGGEADDSRRSPSSSAGGWDDDQKIIHRMKLCKKFYAGEDCPYGDRCNFLHQDPSKFRDDLGRFRESSAISIGTSNPAGPAQGTAVVNGGEEIRAVLNNNNNINNGGLDSGRGIVKPCFWKTRLCNKWEQTGHCPFGEKCHFAHGFPDLQLSSGRIESETMSVGSLTTKGQACTSDLRSPGSTSVGGFDEDLKGKKCLLKWKGLKKINRIYGDWLDDLPLAHNIPSRVET